MQRVVVIFSTKACEQNFFRVGFVIAINIGIDNKVGRARHNDFIAEHGNAKGRNQIFILNKNS